MLKISGRSIGCGAKVKLGKFLMCTVTAALVLGGCAGRATKTGCATATWVGCDGRMGLTYAEGRAAVKQLDPEALPKAAKTTAKNLFEPARYVETTQGSTLTFPNGHTVVYYDKESP
jgi:hypothetical protein